MKYLMLFVTLFWEKLAAAHPGHPIINAPSVWGSFINGAIHPFTGLDHLILTFGLGLLIVKSTRIVRAQKWSVVLCTLFLLWAVTSGYLVASRLSTSTSMVEWGIRLSLLSLSIGLMLNRVGVALVMTLLLAFFHGMAHGMEVPQNTYLFSYLAGLLTSMLLLFFTGFFIAKTLTNKLTGSMQTKFYRAAGVLSLTGLV